MEKDLPVKLDRETLLQLAGNWWTSLPSRRSLRLAVIKRKVSGGSRSMERFQDTANLLTVIQTCRRQGRSVIEFFEQAIKAIVNPDVQAPSLIPHV